MPAPKPLLEEVELFRKQGGGRIRDSGQSGRKSGGKRFAILRTSKIKTMGNMKASLSHTFRERNTPNADPHKLPENSILIGSDHAQGVVDAWQERAPDKIRKNAVHGIEYLVTGSPDAMKEMTREEQDAYFADAVTWLEDKHGKENILSAIVHRDETTPHLTAMVIPLVDGKLNTKHFLGGRQKMREMQTNFAENVAETHYLERGIENSPATHQRVSRHYAAIQTTPEDQISLPERRRGGVLGIGTEKDDEWRQRASEAASEAVWQHRMVAQKFQEEAHSAKILREADALSVEYLTNELEAQKVKNAALTNALEQSRKETAQHQAKGKFLELSAERAGVTMKLESAGQEIRLERQQKEKERVAEVRRKFAAERLAELRATALDVASRVVNKQSLFHVFRGDQGMKRKFVDDISEQLGSARIKRLSEGHADALQQVTDDPKKQRAVAHAYFTLRGENNHAIANALDLDREATRKGREQYIDLGPGKSHGHSL